MTDNEKNSKTTDLSPLISHSTIEKIEYDTDKLTDMLRALEKARKDSPIFRSIKIDENKRKEVMKRMQKKLYDRGLITIEEYEHLQKK